MTDADYMRVALNLALRAKGKTSPNPMVGAVIVKNNRIISQGYHHRCGEDHAEVMALKKAKGSVKGATLYVTLEPCSHYGRTPPCVDKIIQSGIQRVVVGMIDPNPLNNGRSIRMLKEAGIKIKIGVLQKELQRINEAFVKFIKYKIPFVVVKYAQTLDGKIASSTGHSKWITSSKTRDFTYRLRNDFDAILVGINTVLKDNPHLDAPNKKIKKIIADSRLRIPLKAKLFRNTNPNDIIIATTKKASKNTITRLEKKGVEVIVCPEKEKHVDLKWLLKTLAQKEMVYILIEGGSLVIASALREKLVDKFLIFIAPKILGDQEALSSIRGLNIKDVNRALALQDVTFQRIGRDFLLEGYVYGNC